MVDLVPNDLAKFIQEGDNPVMGLSKDLLLILKCSNSYSYDVTKVLDEKSAVS